MKTSILKASGKNAEALWQSLSVIKNKAQQQVFQRKELPEKKGFEILSPYKGEDGKFVKNEKGELETSVCFRFTKDPGPKIEWDETRISLTV